MKINGFIWPEDVIDKLAWKHHITVEEVEEVFENRPRIHFVQKGHVVNEDMYAARGQTEAGRYLTVFFIYKEDRKALLVSARDMDQKERKNYGKKS